MNTQECLAACGMRGEVRRESPLGGGFQAEVRLIELDNGEVIVGKFSLLGDRLVEEENGLRLLRATNTVAVPEVLGATTGALFLEYVAASPLGTDEWSRFGQALAAMGRGSAETRLLLDWHPQRQGEDVPDPYYGGDDGFSHMYDLIEVACAELLDDLTP